MVNLFILIENPIIVLIIIFLLAFSIAYSKEDWLTEVIILLLLAFLISYLSILAIFIIGSYGLSSMLITTKQFAILQQQNISTNINTTNTVIGALSHSLNESFSLYDFIDSHILYEITNDTVEYLMAVIIAIIIYYSVI
jgi:hypothetical protein